MSLRTSVCSEGIEVAIACIQMTPMVWRLIVDQRDYEVLQEIVREEAQKKAQLEDGSATSAGSSGDSDQPLSQVREEEVEPSGDFCLRSEESSRRLAKRMPASNQSCRCRKAAVASSHSTRDDVARREKRRRASSSSSHPTVLPDLLLLSCLVASPG
eukprot:750737-Hanusia_phi.AAC.3